MSITTITQLAPGNALQGTDLFPIDRGVNTLSVAASAIIPYVNALPLTGGTLTGALNINISTPLSAQKGMFSTGNMLLGQNEGGSYFGGTTLTENQLTLVESTVGQTWFTSGSSAHYFTNAMSSNGRVQIAVTNIGYIYVSTDFGKTWSERNTDADAQAYTGVAMSVDGKIQTAVSSGGLIYTSTDYGQTWTPRHVVGNYYSVTMSSDGQTQVVVQNGGSVYISYNFGATWEESGQPNTQNSITDDYFFDVAMSSNAKFQVIVSFGNISDNPIGRLYASSNYGQDWSLCVNNSTPYMAVAMSSDGKYTTAITLSGDIYASTDYGTVWHKTSDLSKVYSCIAMNSTGKIQILGSQEEGLYISTNYGLNWRLYSNPLDIYDVAVSSDGKVITASVDNNPLYVSYTDSVIQGNLNGVSTLQNKNDTVFSATQDQVNPAFIFVDGQLKQVLVGDADSAGTGYRTLRVTN